MQTAKTLKTPMQTSTISTVQDSPNSGAQPFLAIDNVSKVYPTKQGDYTVLKEVSLTVNQGEFICVIGHSGCGKTTLLNMVSGFASPTTGQVRLQGKPIAKPGPDRMVVFQGYALLPWLTVFENVYLGVNGLSRQVQSAKISDRERPFSDGGIDRCG